MAKRGRTLKQDFITFEKPQNEKARKAAEEVFRRRGLKPPWERTEEENEEDKKTFKGIFDAWCRRKRTGSTN